MLCVVDHFEPEHGGVDISTARRRIEAWIKDYPRMAGRHRDADGIMPQHSWFYPPHHEHGFLRDIVSLCRDGMGEIEMHLHHNKMSPFPDTAQTLRDKIEKCIRDYAQHGIFCLPDGSRRFAFIHGDWSLDNACGPKICGINNEIDILRECGCYADFTFPSLGKAQPAMINAFYYAIDNPEKPKSYNRGIPLKTHTPCDNKGLLIVSGILGLRWSSRTHRWRPSIEASNISENDTLAASRLDYLVRNGVRVNGMPNWVFIKLHTHGAPEENWDALFGSSADEGFGYLEKHYNDGEKFRLHYVSARQFYNIIKAAEAGESGNPHDYRDYRIPRYTYLKKD